MEHIILTDMCPGKKPPKLKPTFRPKNLPAQLLEVLRDDIVSGKVGPVLPGERQLALAYHVSRLTIRRTIEVMEKEGVLRRRQNGRLMSGACKTLRKGQPPVLDQVGFITRFQMHELARHELIWLDRLREMLAISGCRLTYHNRTDIFYKDPRSHLHQMVKENHGAIWLLHRSTSAIQTFFAQQKQPAIVVGTSHKGVMLPSVENDQYALSFNAALLAKRRGYARLIFLYSDDSVAGIRRGMDGLRTGIAQAGLRLTLKRYEYDVLPALETVLGLVQRSGERCTLLVDSASAALRSMTWLLGKGVRFPGDMGLFCRDSAAYLSEGIPAVDHYAFDPVTLAQKAHRCVMHLVNGESLHGKTHKIIPSLIKGESL